MLRWMRPTVVVVVLLACGWLLAGAPARAGEAGPELSQAEPAEDTPALNETDAQDVDLGELDLDSVAAAAPAEDGFAVNPEGEIDLGTAAVEGAAAATAQAAAPGVERVITAEDIAQSGARNLADLLAREAGFTVNDTFAGAEVAFQGLPSKFTTVLVDGQRVPGRILERVDFSQLPLANLERVEIIRGPQAAAYGSDSAGVVVNLVTRDSAAAGGAFALGLGSLGWNRQHVEAHGGRGGESWLFAAGREARDKYDLNPRFPDTDGDSFSQHDILGKYQRKLGRDLFRLQLDWFEDEGRGYSFSPPDQLRNNQTLTRRFQSALGYDWRLSGSESLHLTYNYGTYFHDFYRYWAGYEDATATDSQFKDELQDTHAVYAKAGLDYLLTAGAEYNHDALTSDRIGGGGSAQSAIAAGFAAYEWYASPRWTLAGALRYDDHDSFGGEWGPKLSAAYKLDRRSELAAAVGRGARFPSLREQHYEFASPFGYTVLGNPDLAPESTWSYTLDYSYATARGRLRLGAFRHEVSNLIVFNQIQEYPQVYQTENIADARTGGLEFSAERRWDVARQRSVGAGLDTSWLTDSNDAELGTRLPNSPEWDHCLRLFYEQPGLDGELLLRAVDERFLDRENTARAPGYATADLTVRYGLGPGTLTLSGLNLCNERDGKYGPEPGRELRAEYLLEF
jgi:outer membrane receptor for ferrienterochelin and colicins